MANEVAQMPADGDVSPRIALNQAFWDASARKKANKSQKLPDGTQSGDEQQFLAAAREIIAVRRQIQALPSEEDRRLSEAQVNVYFWAVYVVATKSDDLQEVREHAMLFAKIFDYRLKHGWKPAVFDKFGLSSCLLSFAKRIDAASKSAGGNAKPILYEIAHDYLQLAGMACDYLVAADFQQRKITDAERARLTKPGQKPLKMKVWPSNAEKIIKVAARCVKENAATSRPLVPSPRLLEFLRRHLDAGKWFGYYYARWLVQVGRHGEAVEPMRKVVASKQQEMWAWSDFAETFANTPSKARDCLCRALLCSVHDPMISAAMAKKVHRKLESVLRTLGELDVAQREAGLAQSEQPLPGQRAYYEEWAHHAEVLLLDPKASRSFEGVFEQRAGQAFGFVRVGYGRGGDSIFVPPSLAKRFKSDDRVKGMAALQMDRKKNREGWAAAFIEPDENGLL